MTTLGHIGALDLADLGEEIPALTVALGALLREACLICFADQGHVSGVRLKVTGTFNARFLIEWNGDVTERMRRAWNDLDEATEQAAVGIALLLIRELTGYTAVERSRRGTGFDYWLGQYDETAEQPFQYMARLEVSGLRQAAADRVKQRVNEKKRQTNRSDGVFPAYVIVVEFGKPLAVVVQK